MIRIRRKCLIFYERVQFTLLREPIPSIISYPPFSPPRKECGGGCNEPLFIHLFTGGFSGECTALAIGSRHCDLSMLCVAETFFFCFHSCGKYRYISPGCRRENGNPWKERGSNIQLSALPKNAINSCSDYSVFL